MRNPRMFIASAIALLGLLTATGALNYGLDDMHWPTGPAATVIDASSI
jgi:hypothetical protein